MPVHENLSAAMPACHAERSEASKLPPDQNTAKPPNTPSNSYAREGKPPSHSPATPHDSGAIIWPGGNSGSQEAGGTLPPRLRGEAGREAAQHHSHQPSCCFPHAAERKGAVMLSEAKHLKSRPTKTPRSHPNLLPQCPRSASVRARRGGLRTASAALRQPGN